MKLICNATRCILGLFRTKIWNKKFQIPMLIWTNCFINTTVKRTLAMPILFKTMLSTTQKMQASCSYDAKKMYAMHFYFDINAKNITMENMIKGDGKILCATFFHH